MYIAAPKGGRVAAARKAAAQGNGSGGGGNSAGAGGAGSGASGGVGAGVEGKPQRSKAPSHSSLRLVVRVAGVARVDGNPAGCSLVCCDAQDELRAQVETLVVLKNDLTKRNRELRKVCVAVAVWL